MSTPRPNYSSMMKDQPQLPPRFDGPGTYRFPIPGPIPGVDNWQSPVPLLRGENAGNSTLPQPQPTFSQNSQPTVSWLCSCNLCVASVQSFMTALRSIDALNAANIATAGPVYGDLVASAMLPPANGEAVARKIEAPEIGPKNVEPTGKLGDGISPAMEKEGSNDVPAGHDGSVHLSSAAAAIKLKLVDGSATVENEAAKMEDSKSDAPTPEKTGDTPGENSADVSSTDAPNSTNSIGNSGVPGVATGQNFSRPPSYFYYSPSMYYSNPFIDMNNVRMQMPPPQYYSNYYWDNVISQSGNTSPNVNFNPNNRNPYSPPFTPGGNQANQTQLSPMDEQVSSTTAKITVTSTTCDVNNNEEVGEIAGELENEKSNENESSDSEISV